MNTHNVLCDAHGAVRMLSVMKWWRLSVELSWQHLQWSTSHSKTAEKLAKFRVWDKIPKWSTLILDTRIPLQNNEGKVKGSLCAQSRLDSFSYLDTTPTCDRHPHRQTG